MVRLRPDGRCVGGWWAEDRGIMGEIFFQVGPTLLFPVAGVALAVATLGYYERRRGPCRVWSWRIQRGWRAIIQLPKELTQ